MSRNKRSADRTSLDEYQFDQNLRREEDIKTEVIVELRNENRGQREALKRVMETLNRQSKMLRDSLAINEHYRSFVVKQLEGELASDSHCKPGCTKHVWHDSDGWHRPEEFSA